MKSRIETVKLEKIVNDGQSLGTLENGQKVFVWGALPGETAEVKIIKKKNKLAQGIAENIILAAPERIEPKDADSFLSTSPWQIMDFASENKWKQQLVEDAFQLHGIELPESEIIVDGKIYNYRNKIEFSWWWDKEKETLDLAFFRRGSKGKIPVSGTSLARNEINEAARNIRDLLRAKQVEAYDLKTLLLRCDQNGNINAQLYVKNENFNALDKNDFVNAKLRGLEIIYSNPKSPASIRTKLLDSFGKNNLQDNLLGKNFTYSTGGFFQVNLPVYELALQEIKKFVPEKTNLLDLYSGVGTIGLSVSENNVTLVEQDESCIEEMRRNVAQNDDAKIIHASSETALKYITSDKTVIVDPPRAGLHWDVVQKLNDIKPARIIYLSCNPVTQARDVGLLLQNYKIIESISFNFFPRTPHIEHLVILELS